mmetsp:Transcript_16533/g.30581  ORF Transcript_16533/g.30581 Transcript_16533/m.30581 type:complete len:298 (-) Transcript_16533:73-966(-)
MRASLSEFEVLYEVPVTASGISSGKMHTVWRRRGCSLDSSAGDNNEDNEVTVKIVNAQEIPTLKEAEGILAEVSLLAAVQHHPNILGYYGFLSSKGDNDEDFAPKEPLGMSIVVDYCSGGDLLTAVVESPFSEKRANKVIKGILSGLVHLHSMDIVHRDIKADNVMLACGDWPVISDFRVAAHTSDAKEMMRRCGSPGYVAPEIILGSQYSAKVDCFSTGVVLFFVLCGQLPFVGNDIMSVMRRTLRDRVTFDLPRFEHVSVRCKMFIASLVCKTADDRPDATAALEDCWLAMARHD